MANHQYNGDRGARSIPPTERIEYVNAHWLLENETDGTYGDFGAKIGKSRQEIGRLLRAEPQFGISSQMARKIEKGFGKPSNWLSQDHGHPQPRTAYQQAKKKSIKDLLSGYSNDVTLSRFTDNAILKWGGIKSC